MAICAFEEQYNMFDVTPVENLYIEEYMLRAPGDYVKVYLYGLKLCYHCPESLTLEGIARALGMEVGAVSDAFSYWERQNVIRRVQDVPPRYMFMNLKHLLTQRTQTESDELYRYKEFNNSLQGLFASRILHPSDYAKAYDWIENLGILPETVLMLVQHCIKLKGNKPERVTFAYIDTIAARWAKDGIRTLSDAEEYLARYEESFQNARQILRKFRIYRFPTEDEEALVKKWMNMGFTLEAMLAACAEVTKIKEPNFAYLDKVMETSAARGNLSAQSILEYKQRRDESTQLLNELFSWLGARKVMPTEDMLDKARGFLDRGFEREALRLIAEPLARMGRNTFELLSLEVDTYASNGLYTAEAIRKYTEMLKDEAYVLRKIFHASGDDRLVSNGERKILQTWTEQGFTNDMLIYAAEQSSLVVGNKMHYMRRILERWQEQGIKTLTQARVDTETNPHAYAALRTGGGEGGTPVLRQSKPVTAQNFGQRSYTEAEDESLIFDLASWEGEDI